MLLLIQRHTHTGGIQKLVIINEWTPTFAIGHLPSKTSLTEDERELTDSQNQKIMDTHRSTVHGTIQVHHAFVRRRHLWILRVEIHVRSETEKIVCISSPTNVLESHSLVKFSIDRDRDQSPRNWRRRLSHIGTNPQGWSTRWCHGDITISISSDVPLWKSFILWTLE